MMKQYTEIKDKNKDSILFFRLGDFYEMFFDDALTASMELEITLTKRDIGSGSKAPMCGVPHHVADTYIARLVNKGYKVAICDQVEDPATAKGIVKREVTKIVTPGTILDSSIVDEKSNNFLASIYFDDLGAGITFVDNSTGEMYTTEFIGKREESYRFITDELGKHSPSETICNEGFLDNDRYINIIKNTINPYISTYEDINNEFDIEDKVIKFFNDKSISELGIETKAYATISTSKLIDYLYETQKDNVDHINNLIFYEARKYMMMDINTRRNLEIEETIRSKSKKGTLIGVLNQSMTAMGGRLIKKWLHEPLLEIKNINSRLDLVSFFFDNLIVLDELRDLLKGVYDIERLTTKISNGNCNGRDFISLKNSLSIIPHIKDILTSSNNMNLIKFDENIEELNDILDLIEESIDDNPPVSIKEGGLIKLGFNKELDELKQMSQKGKTWLSDLEAKEKSNTGIKNLKVGYNRIAGYYIEVTKSNIDLVPDYFVRKQTLTNSERYYTEELKNMEARILGADEQALNLEYKIFVEIRGLVKNNIIRLQKLSRNIAILDALSTFAKVSKVNNFVRPELNDKGFIKINNGRHPVVESTLKDFEFVPNDSYIDLEDNLIQLITGPNMAGKSTYMRQIAIVCLLAQIGCYVPAESANLSILDQIFTRIGASDNLSQGESTFMVEMSEVANIVSSASRYSLIILDEIGRGTSTYDGLSIAWAVIEYIASNIKAKTLFATHYHELTQLEDKIKGIKNLTILAEEKGSEIVFLRKIVEGSSNKSYGIEVAQLAGIKNEIIERSKEILKIIEGTHKIQLSNDQVQNQGKQINLLDYRKDYFLERISTIDVQNLTPIDSLNLLNNLIEDSKKLRENLNE